MESFFFPGPEAVEPKNEYICVNILSAGASSCNEKQFSRSWSYTLKHFLFDLLEKTTWAVIHLYKFMFQAISVHWGPCAHVLDSKCFIKSCGGYKIGR